MRPVLHALPTVAVSLAALLFVAWVSVAASGGGSLYAEALPAAAAGG